MGQRLREAERVLCLGEHPFDGVDAVSLLEHLAEAVRVDPSGGRLWLLFTAVAGAFPTDVQHEALRRRFEFAVHGEALKIVLECTEAAAAKAGEWSRPLRIVESAIVVDVNFCAKFAHNTGIQRVVRSLMPHLMTLADGNLQLVAWTKRNGLTRSLTALERARVLDWPGVSTGAAVAPSDEPDELVVPWNSSYFIPEVPEKELCDRLAALAEFSGNRVSLIGYDTIPIGSADLVSAAESERFARYLTIVKHVDEVIAISESVAEEFRGFTTALGAQGLVGPTIHSIPLAADVPDEPAKPDEDAVKPLVISVGSHEPRKNQDAVLFAVETLLGEGLDFRFVFVGGGSRDRTLPFDRKLRALRAERGWDIQSVRGMSDAKLWALYGQARFSVFASLHEGYGLPVVESLASGTPVLTANYGSLAEIAAGGGCLTIDPRDDDAIIAGIRTLLTDETALAKLQREAAKRHPRNWSNYAADVWKNSALAVKP